MKKEVIYRSWAEGVVPKAECLPSKRNALSSTPNQNNSNDNNNNNIYSLAQIA
jgi:hypothetical protein